jgi:GMP synthase-like glutamine amidotransferase
VVLLHDNTRLHTARQTTALLQQFHWDIMDHPPYSPDLAPSDYHLFLHMKRFLAGKQFHSDAEVKTTVNNWLQQQAVDFFDTGIQKLVT